MEEAWMRASALLDAPLQKTASATSELERRYALFARICLASPSGNWLVSMKSGKILPGGVAFGGGARFNCEAERTTLVVGGDAVKAALDDLERQAHSKGVLPGHWRRLVATYGLEIWDQY
jgi:hypothetical protein